MDDAPVPLFACPLCDGHAVIVTGPTFVCGQCCMETHISPPSEELYTMPYPLTSEDWNRFIGLVGIGQYDIQTYLPELLPPAGSDPTGTELAAYGHDARQEIGKATILKMQRGWCRCPYCDTMLFMGNCTPNLSRGVRMAIGCDDAASVEIQRMCIPCLISMMTSGAGFPAVTMVGSWWSAAQVRDSPFVDRVAMLVSSFRQASSALKDGLPNHVPRNMLGFQRLLLEYGTTKTSATRLRIQSDFDVKRRGTMLPRDFGKAMFGLTAKQLNVSQWDYSDSRKPGFCAIVAHDLSTSVLKQPNGSLAAAFRRSLLDDYWKTEARYRLVVAADRGVLLTSEIIAMVIGAAKNYKLPVVDAGEDWTPRGDVTAFKKAVVPGIEAVLGSSRDGAPDADFVFDAEAPPGHVDYTEEMNARTQAMILRAEEDNKPAKDVHKFMETRMPGKKRASAGKARPSSAETPEPNAVASPKKKTKARAPAKKRQQPGDEAPDGSATEPEEEPADKKSASSSRKRAASKKKKAVKFASDVKGATDEDLDSSVEPAPPRKRSQKAPKKKARGDTQKLSLATAIALTTTSARAVGRKTAPRAGPVVIAPAPTAPEPDEEDEVVAMDLPDEDDGELAGDDDGGDLTQEYMDSDEAVQVVDESDVDVGMVSDDSS